MAGVCGRGCGVRGAMIRRFRRDREGWGRGSAAWDGRGVYIIKSYIIWGRVRRR